MLAAVTSKGQLTLPKAIRQQLNLGQGSRLDFSVSEQGWLMARPVTNTALSLAGILRRPGQAAVSVEAMADAVEATAAESNRSTHKPSSAAPKRKAARKA